MAIEIGITCTNFFMADNPEWAGSWASSTPEQRKLADETLRADYGLTSATMVDYNSSVAPSYVYPPGHPCYDATKMRGLNGGVYAPSQVVIEPAMNGSSNYALNGSLPGFGLGLLNVSKSSLLIAFIAILLGSAIIYRVTR